MKILVSLAILGTLLMAGGDIKPTKQKPVAQKMQPTKKCFKPNIKKCVNCQDVAEICPDDPSLPMAKTEPCSAETK
jgi:CO dehydrogenase/acetyl-CoA synthase alpha subunit